MSVSAGISRLIPLRYILTTPKYYQNAASLRVSKGVIFCVVCYALAYARASANLKSAGCNGPPEFDLFAPGNRTDQQSGASRFKMRQLHMHLGEAVCV